MDPEEKKSTAFETNERDDGKTDIYFNRGSEDGDKHGHVVQSGEGNDTVYHYVRDEDGNVYIDDSKD